MNMSTYTNDPRWTKAKFTSTCCQCGAAVAKLAKIFYFPIGKKVYCAKCGEPHAARFAAEVADEEMMRGAA
jgi:hypothetical protein